MRRFLGIFVVVGLCIAQTGLVTINSGSVNLSGATHTLTAKVVATVGTLPATCTAGELAVVTGAVLTQQIYECSTGNVWTQQGGVGAYATVTGCQVPSGLDLSGVTDNHTQVQNAINAMSAAGGCVILPIGTINLGTVGISVTSADSGYRIFSEGAGHLSTVLKYSGTGSAVTFGDNSAITNGAALVNVTIDISGGSSPAIAFNAVRTFWLVIEHCYFTTNKGGGAVDGETAIKLDGGTGTNFSAYTQIVQPQISGDFTNGIQVTATAVASNNSGQIYGGSIAGTTAGPAVNGIGVNFLSADTWRMSGTDLTGWDTGLKIVTNNGGPFDARMELNNTNINASGSSNYFYCACGVGTVTNTGIDNFILFSVQGTTNQLFMPGARFPAGAVGNLPTCNAAAQGLRRAVGDSNAASYTAGIGAVVAGGGGLVVPVFCDGTNWRIG